jgi:Astacin (Peptidase family M12A)
MAVAESNRYCSLPSRPARTAPPELPHDRQRAILAGGGKWVNGTVLHYCFFTDGQWAIAADQQDVVRGAFKEWKDLGIGLSYEEVKSLSEAEVRIGYLDGDGSWSAVGRDVLTIKTTERTMNFGWDLTTEYGHTTARHEIGHTLGLEHEHQNPFAGIVWNEDAVYTSLGGPPNNWSHDTTFQNILRKLNPAEVEGSKWDPDSIMEYAFDAGLIQSPTAYANGLTPPGTISASDRESVLKWYPSLDPAGPAPLEPFKSVPLALPNGGQADFKLDPPGSRTYQLGTFGTADAVVVLFENVDGKLKYVAGNDDTGTEANAKLSVKLFQGRQYVLRVRLIWTGGSGTAAVMYW